MRLLLAFFLLCLFFYGVAFGVPVLAVVAATLFVYRHQGLGLFFVAVLIDAFLGQFATWPALSVSVGVFVLVAEALKLFLRGTQAIVR